MTTTSDPPGSTAPVTGLPSPEDEALSPDNVLGLVGNTPIVFPGTLPVAVKLEGRQPSGSLFDRVGSYATFTASDLHIVGTAALIASMAQVGAVFGLRVTYSCTDPGRSPIGENGRSHFLEFADVLGAESTGGETSSIALDLAGATRALLDETLAQCAEIDPDRRWTIVIPPEATLVAALADLDNTGLDADVRVAPVPEDNPALAAQTELAACGVLIDELSAAAYSWTCERAARDGGSWVVVSISDGAMNEAHIRAAAGPQLAAVELASPGAGPPAPDALPASAARPADLVGNTPVLHASHFRPEHGATITLKLESMNATGSIKARAARRMVLEARDRGDLPPGRPLVEPSSGNLGLALAMVAASLGIECHLVCDPRMTQYSKQVMAAYGAHIHTVTAPDERGSWQGSRLSMARKIEKELGALILVQYSNPDNALAHASETGPELLLQLGRPPDVCVVGISTGGHMTGLGRAFRAAGARTRMVGVDVEGSSIFGGSYEAYRLRGLGLSWWPANLDPSVIDDVYRINEKQAFASARLLAHREGVVSGGAAGAVMAAATAEAARLDPTQHVLAVIAERGDRYLRNFYSREYRLQNDLDLDYDLAGWTDWVSTLEPIERSWQDPGFIPPPAPNTAVLTERQSGNDFAQWW